MGHVTAGVLEGYMPASTKEIFKFSFFLGFISRLFLLWKKVFNNERFRKENKKTWSSPFTINCQSPVGQRRQTDIYNALLLNDMNLHLCIP